MAKNDLQIVNPDAAGIDVGSTELWASVPEDRSPTPVRMFGVFTRDLHALSGWLKELGIKTIAMESTGVYWIPAYQRLEADGFSVCLVNARHVKGVPGRPKTDKDDCRWLMRLHSYGLLNASFRPNDEVCRLRAILRHRERLVQEASTQSLRMQKSLREMNVQLDLVVTDVTGQTGMSIITAIIDGERDLGYLASMRDPRCKASKQDIVKALEGDYREEHVFTLRLACEAYHFFQKQIAECDLKARELTEGLAKEDAKDGGRPPSPPAGESGDGSLKERLKELLGVDATTLPGLGVESVQALVSELGLDFGKWRDAKHFASYLGKCPDLKISNSKVLGKATRRVNNRAARVFNLAARSAGKTKTCLGVFYRRLKCRIGAPKALAALSHKLAVIFYKMVVTGKEFEDLGADYYDRLNRVAALKALRRRARDFGMELVPAAGQ